MWKWYLHRERKRDWEPFHFYLSTDGAAMSTGRTWIGQSYASIKFTMCSFPLTFPLSYFLGCFFSFFFFHCKLRFFFFSAFCLHCQYCNVCSAQTGKGIRFCSWHLFTGSPFSLCVRLLFPVNHISVTGNVTCQLRGLRENHCFLETPVAVRWKHILGVRLSLLFLELVSVGEGIRNLQVRIWLKIF